jgi:hypothetical protein
MLADLPATGCLAEAGRDPVTMTQTLIAFWRARWGSCERLSDLPTSGWEFEPWGDYLAPFDVVDSGGDFRAGLLGRKLTPVFGRNCSGAILSRFPAPQRQDLRQLLLRALIIRKPVVRHYNWLTEDFLWSCVTCAIPVAGGLFQPSRIAVGIFYRIGQFFPAASVQPGGLMPATAFPAFDPRYPQRL